MVEFEEKLFIELRREGLPFWINLGNLKAIGLIDFDTESAARSAVFRHTFPVQLFGFGGKLKFKLVDLVRLLAGIVPPGNYGPPSSSRLQGAPTSSQVTRPRGRPRKIDCSDARGGVK